MNTAAEPWLAAYLTVGLGLFVGLIIAWRLPRPSLPLATAARDSVRDLETRYDQYIAQLRDVAQQQHRLTSGAFDKERAEYEALAQATLVQLSVAKAQLASQTQQHSEKQTPPRRMKNANSFWARHPQLAGGLWGAGAMGVAAFLYTTVQQEGYVASVGPSAPNSSAAPAQGAPGAMPQVGAGVDAEAMKTLAQQIKDNPDDADKLLQFAHMLLRAQMLEEARTINDRALRLRPNDLEALTHAAVLSASSGDSSSSDIGLDMVLKKDPTFVEAWFFRGMLAMQRGDHAKVEASFAAYLKHAPPGAQKDRVADMLARMQSGG